MRKLVLTGLLVLATLLYAFNNVETVEITGYRWYMWEWSHGGDSPKLYGGIELPTTIKFNNTSSYWMGNVSQEGFLTYCNAPPLVNEFNIDKDVRDLYLTIRYRINNVKCSGIIHVGVALYIKLDTNYLAIDLLLYANDLVENHWCNESIDPDYHSQFLIFKSNIGEWHELNVDISKYIVKSLNHWGLRGGKLVAVQLYIDGVNSSGEAEFNNVKLEYKPSIATIITSSKVLTFIVVAVILISILEILLKKL